MTRELTTPPHVGYIGLGIMGKPMALRILQAGYKVTLWARRQDATIPLVEMGANVANSLADLAQQVDILFINVSDTADVETILLGSQGVMEGARPGLIVVDHSTISALRTRVIATTLQSQGIAMLDAPVSGGEQGAREGTLSLMVGGDAQVLEKVMPLLKAVGQTIVHIGDHGAGQIAKACNQMLVAQTMLAVGEAFLFAEAAGVDAAKVREALLGGFAYSRILETHGKRMLEQDFKPGFKARLHRKDMGIVLDTAQQLGVPVPGCALATQYINACVGQGLAEYDSSAIAQVQRHFLPQRNA